MIGGRGAGVNEFQSGSGLFSQARNLPPPQMQSMSGEHSLGHQQGSVRAAQRSLAARHSHALIAEHGTVVVAPSGLLLP